MRYLLFLILVLSLASCNNPKEDTVENHAFTNDLINETSPYLLQHAHNPVNWKPWKESTIQKAKEERKLMVISIGYAACHWCHVMERESFEDSIVASIMNDNFIPVKVDREERPDVDKMYINAVELMTGSAGWPLNVVTLPDGRPVWGGTYFGKDDWIDALEQIQTVYEEEPQKLEEYASRLAEGVKSMDLVSLNADEVDFSSYNFTELLSTWQQTFDDQYGGSRRAPKFMMPNNLDFLMREASTTKNPSLLKHVTLTLDKMAYGGVYDAIGGGFSRYSTDMKWHIPHFEKMLYDNGQLVSLYSKAYAINKNPLYKEIVEETLAFIAREMTTQEGAFYSSLDADSETEAGELEEGTYYIYTKEELQGALQTDFDLFSAYYNVNDFGIWEDDQYVLIRNKSDEEIIEEFSITSEILKNKKENWRKTLLDFRNKRIRPRLDDKTQSSWNGLMLKGYIDAYKVFQKREYLDVALKNAQFLAQQQLQDNGALYHIYKDGKSSINGYLEDYSAVIDAYIALYEVTLDQQWIDKAKKMTDYSFEHFFDADKSMFYFSSNDDTDIVTRSFEYRDNVIPSSNSMMAKNLMVLAHHYDEQNYAATAQQMLKNVLPEIDKYPGGFSNWLDLMANYRSKYYEIVVVGPNAKEKVKELNSLYIPNKLIAGSTSASMNPLLEGRYMENETFIYVCVNNTCKLPVKDVSKAMELIQ